MLIQVILENIISLNFLLDGKYDFLISNDTLHVRLHVGCKLLILAPPESWLTPKAGLLTIRIRKQKHSFGRKTRRNSAN